jgi:hypothetical protein
LQEFREEYRKKNDQRKDSDHGFPIPEPGEAAPSGVPAPDRDTGPVNPAISRDTADPQLKEYPGGGMPWQGHFSIAAKLPVARGCGGS